MNIEPLYDKKTTCPYCKNSFVTKKLRTKFIKIISWDTDYCPTYETETYNPDYYMSHVCNLCGYTHIDKFQNKFTNIIRKNIEEGITKKWHAQIYNQERTPSQAIDSLKLALISGLYANEKKGILGGIALRIAWIYRRHHSHEERRFLEMAATFYADSYSSGDFEGTDLSIKRILYLTSECYYRIGEEEKALFYLSKAIQIRDIGHEAELTERIKNRWKEIRDDKSALQKVQQ